MGVHSIQQNCLGKYLLQALPFERVVGVGGKWNGKLGWAAL